MPALVAKRRTEANGNLGERDDGSSTRVYAYDDNGQPTEIDHSGTEETESLCVGDGTRSRRFDPSGMRTSPWTSARTGNLRAPTFSEGSA